MNTWGYIQLESIRKMFVNTTTISINDLNSMKTDKKYATYLDAMPGAANEGIMIMLTRGKPYIVNDILSVSQITREYPLDNYYCFNLNDTLTNYLKLNTILIDGKEYKGYILRNNRYLYIPTQLVDNHVVTVAYETYPDAITSTTSNNATIDLPIDMIRLLPLYIASELYKDDDISLATAYRNEFETELENMRPQHNEQFVSITGWY